MKLIKLTIFLFISVILFSGCLKVNSNVIINKDGSGILEEQVLMSDMVISMMNEFMSSFQDSTSAPEEFKLFKEDELKAKSSEYGEGVKYVSGEEIKIDGWRGYKAIYSFEDLNKIKMETDPNTKVENPQDDEQATEYFSFKFIPGDIAELIIDRPDLSSEKKDEEISVETGTENQELDDNLIKMMDGMTMTISLEFNGEIVETNASYVDDSKVTMLDIDFSEILKNKESLELFKKNPPDNLDEMKAIVENIPGMKVEFKKPVIVKFK
ncbi:MAG: hypothetical protein V3W20_05655 [Candidatus Neomarinimicrobiota bacterium]